MVSIHSKPLDLTPNHRFQNCRCRRWVPNPFLPSQSSEDALGKRVDLQSAFGHLGVLQELQREPHQVAPDLVELLARVLGGHELVEDVPRLDAPRGEEPVVVLKRFDCAGRLAKNQIIGFKA